MMCDEQKPTEQLLEESYDLYTEQAKRLYGTDSPTEEQRNGMKTVMFGILYGASPAKLRSILEGKA